MAAMGVAVVGYGYWGPNLARCVAEAEDARLAMIVEPDAQRRAAAARRHPTARVVTEVREALGDGAVDAIAIATPVQSHFEIALAALRAGRHVLIEKPMTSTAAEARRLVEEAAQRNLVLMVDHTFVYAPVVTKIIDLVKNEHIGEINYFDSIRINLGICRNDVNVIWDLAVHDLTIIDVIFADSPVAISVQAARHVVGTLESMAFVTLFFTSGAVAHINVNWLAPVKIRQTLIGGSRKMIVWDDLQPSEKLKVYDRGVVVNGDRDALNQLRIGYRAGDMWAPHLTTAEPLKLGIDQFVHCVAHGQTPLTDGRSGLRVVELLEFASASMRQGGRPIDLHPERLAS